MRRLNYFSTLIVGTCLFSCVATNLVTTYYSNKYDKRNDQTSVKVSPLGEVKIPGKWTKTRENEVSGQHFFVGPDSVQITIALVVWDAYEFSHNNREVTRDNFVRRFYEWEGNHLKEKANGQLRIVKESKDKNYLIWNLKNEEGLNVYFLFGLKGETAYNLNVKTTMWDEEKKVNFLERLFNV